MANTIQIKHGSSSPTTSNLAPFELGYVKGGALYINNDGTIQQLTGLAASGLVNSSNYLKIPAIAATTLNTDKILVCNAEGVIYYKTADNIRSEIKAFSITGGTISGKTIFDDLATFSNKIVMNNSIIINENSYGTQDPNTANIEGTLGQLYFVIVE